MYYAYLKEDNDSINLVDNAGVKSLIQDLSIVSMKKISLLTKEVESN